MNATDDITRLVRDWLAEPATLPTAAGIERVAQRVDRTPQQRGWLRPLPRLPRRTLIPAVAVVIAGAAALASSMLLTGASPAPTLALVTEAVEPGVVKVIGDGAGHDLDGMPLDGVATGADGTVWLLSAVPPPPSDPTADLGTNGLLALGRPGTWGPGPLAGVWRPDIAVAPDGTLWASSDGQLRQFDGQAWTVQGAVPGEVQGVVVARDGTVWAAWKGADSRPEAGYVGPAGWSTIDDSLSPATDAGGSSLQTFAVTPDGEAWLGVGVYKSSHWRGLLRSTDRSGWVVEHPLGERDDLGAGPMAAGSDGTLWVYEAIGDFSSPERYLLRHGASGWTTWSAEDGVPQLVGHKTFRASLAVAGDGTLWITNASGKSLPPELGPNAPGTCPGVLSFDGRTWRQYLAGTCVNHVAFGTDGSVWATSETGWTSDSPEQPSKALSGGAGLYLIHPDAAVAPSP